MNIYFHELRAYRKFTIIWTASLMILFFLYFSMFPTITKDAESFIKMLENYPQELKNMMGLEIESVTSLLGFYGFTLSFVTLCAGIMALYIGLAIVSKEERNKTVDFLLTKPVSRIRILSNKILAGFSLLLLSQILFLICAWIMVEIIKTNHYNRPLFFKMTITIFLIQLMFYALGILLSVSLPKLKSVLTLSLGVVFGFYMMGSFLATTPDDYWRFISPFKYFDANFIYKVGYDWYYLVIAFLFISISTVVSYIIYHLKDIHAV